MKKIVLALFVLGLSSLGFAQEIRPRVYHMFDEVRVDVWNHTNDDYQCSGYVHVSYDTGRFESVHYFETIYAHQNRSSKLWTRNQGRITFVTDSIYCREI